MSVAGAPSKSLSPPLAAIVAMAPVILAAALGNLATMPNLAPWYAELVKPPLNPPNWLFGPAWTTLYALMAYAFYRILRLDPASQGRSLAITVFLVQLALNASWSFAFFAARSPALGLLVIMPLELLIYATFYLFKPLDRIAAHCLIPYMLWVAFATYLNAGIWMLN